MSYEGSCKIARAPRNKAGQVKLAFVLRFKGPAGEFIRSWEGTDIDATPQNERLLKAKATLIENELENGNFSYLQHFPQGNKARLFIANLQRSNEPQTVRQYHTKWKLDKKPPFIRKTLARSYTGHFNAHILPLHGDKYMHLYGFNEIRELRANIVEVKERKMKTAKNVIGATLRAFFRDAKAEGIIATTPFDDLPDNWWPIIEFPPPDPFTEEQRDEIIEYFRRKYLPNWPQAYMFVHDLFWTGARPSELVARVWRDYDPRTGKLSIRTSLAEKEEGATKTPASKRDIELFPNVRTNYDQFKPLRVKPTDSIYTKRPRAGHGLEPIDQKEFANRHFWPALTVLKIAHKDFYSTRDTFISVMLSHGEPLQKVAEYCGTSPQMIDKSYGKYIGGWKNFGQAALENAKDASAVQKTVQKVQTATGEDLKLRKVRVVRGAGFEP
jgi:integrase